MKGISPMLAVILLIAFTVAVGGLLSVWMITMTRTQTEVAGAGAEKLIACSKSVLDIGLVKNNTATYNNFTVQVIYYAGSEELYNFTIYLSDEAGNIGKNISSDFIRGVNTMKPGQIHSFIAVLDKTLTGLPKRARVTALCQETEVVSAEEVL